MAVPPRLIGSNPLDRVPAIIGNAASTSIYGQSQFSKPGSQGTQVAGKLVNLKQFKKEAARIEKSNAAAANAVKFGRTKAQRLLEAAREDLAARRLDDK
jgi:hypothetical protein